MTITITIDSITYTEEAWRNLPGVGPCEGTWDDFIFAAGKGAHLSSGVRPILELLS